MRPYLDYLVVPSDSPESQASNDWINATASLMRQTIQLSRLLNRSLDEKKDRLQDGLTIATISLPRDNRRNMVVIWRLIELYKCNAY